MNDQQLEKLLMTRGADYPPVANALAQLPDGHPLKEQVMNQPSIPSIPEVDTVSARLDDLEARVAALEA